MKPLLFIAPALPQPPTTGGEIFNRRLTEGLAASWKVRTLTRADLGLGPDDSPARCAAALRSHPAGCEPSAVFIDTYLYRQFGPGLAELRRGGFGPFIGFGQAWYPARYRSLLSRLRVLFPLARFLHRLDRHVVVSESLRSECARVGIPRSRVDVVLPGFDLASLRPVVRSEGLPLRVSTAGTYMPAKGQQLFVGAIERLAAGDSALIQRMRFTAIGPKTQNPGFVADLEARANRLPPGLVSLHGAMHQDDLWTAFRASDVFVFPATGEGLGMVVVEAMLCGAVPVVSPDGPLREIVGEDGSAGLVVPREAASIARVLDDLSKDPERLKTLRLRARERGLALAPTWERSIARIDGLLRNACDEPEAWRTGAGVGPHGRRRAVDQGIQANGKTPVEWAETAARGLPTLRP